MGNQEKYVHSVSEYLNVIQELNKAYLCGTGHENPICTKFLYRGMSDKTYDLIPGIFRKDRIEDESIIIDNNRYLSFATEKDIMQHFKQESTPYTNHLNMDSPIKWLELAQHYGVPTRLLDWTENPLVALYFACESNSQNNDAIVWMLHRFNYLRFAVKKDSNIKTIPKGETICTSIEKLLAFSDDNQGQEHSLLQMPILYTPYYLDNRMSAQGSWFMVWGTNILPLNKMIEKENYMSYSPSKNKEVVHNAEQYKEFSYNFIIPKSCKQKLIRELDLLGINAKTLFPGLDGIGKHIERIHRFDYWEAVNC